MDIRGKIVVVTGAGRGIGKAMAERFARDGAEAVIVSDLNEGEADAVADGIRTNGGAAEARRADVAVEVDIQALATLAQTRFGRIDLFCSNAGFMRDGDENAPDQIWATSWNVNVMAHVYAARAVLPEMLERRSGYLLNTCSGAGLLTSLGAAPYAAAKHAAVAFAEWLAITYGDRGVKVSALCPLAVRTDMFTAAAAGGPGLVKSAGRVLEPEDVAESVVRALAEERFLILPHEEMADFVKRKASDPERWIKGMRKLLTPA